jgi:hypothetical protein
MTVLFTEREATYAGLFEQTHALWLQDAGADSRLDLRARSVIHHSRVNTRKRQETSKH